MSYFLADCTLMSRTLALHFSGFKLLLFRLENEEMECPVRPDHYFKNFHR